MSGSISSACLKILNRLVEILHLLVAHALKVIRIRIPRIDLHRLLKALQRRLQFIARMLRQPQVVPRLRALRVQSNAACSAFFASSSFCSVISAMPSLIAACASFGSFLNASANEPRRALGKLLPHLRHAAIVGRTASASKRASAPRAATAIHNISPNGPEILKNLFPKVSSPTATPVLTG
jgi:hypothetical protein